MADQQRLTLPTERPDPDRQKILELVSEAWIDSRKLQLRYSPFRGKRDFDDVLHPYMIEPSAIGRSTYVIGHSELAGAMRVYKIERIATITTVLKHGIVMSLRNWHGHWAWRLESCLAACRNPSGMTGVPSVRSRPRKLSATQRAWSEATGLVATDPGLPS
jgi:predicted DNA-binding transcriptional regulator YafY